MKMNKIISYALDFLCANFDDDVEEDIGITHKGLEQFVEKYKERPVLTVDAIVVKDEKFLLIKRKNPPYGWALPGGLVDKGETVETAVVRELKEETCLEAGDIKFYKIVSDPNRDPRFHAISAVYIITNVTGTAVAADDAKEVGWFSYDEIMAMDIAFDHKDIISNYFQTYSSISESFITQEWK